MFKRIPPGEKIYKYFISYLEKSKIIQYNSLKKECICKMVELNVYVFWCKMKIVKKITSVLKIMSAKNLCGVFFFF